MRLVSYPFQARIEPRNIRSKAPSPTEPQAMTTSSLQFDVNPAQPSPCCCHSSVRPLHHVIQQPLPRCCSCAAVHHRLPHLTHHPPTLTRLLQRNHTYFLDHGHTHRRSLNWSCRPPRRKLRAVHCAVCSQSQLRPRRKKQIMNRQPLSRKLIANANAMQIRERVQCRTGRVRASTQPEQCLCVRSCTQPGGDYGSIESSEESQ